jgi:hypothetical protein
MVGMLELQRVLRAGEETVETLVNRGIRAKEHPEHSGLWHFCYDQLEANPNDPIVKESRGMILNGGDNWNTVAAPFFRFANHGESWADSIDWKSARVQEKVDGSLMIVWYWGGQWNVSTKGSPNAGGLVDVHPFTFSELFWRIWKDRGYDVEELDTDWTFMFELISPFNRVVCQYPEPDLVFLGARNRVTMQEAEVDDLGHPLLPPVVKEYSLSSIDDVIAAAQKLTPESGEGFVVVDQNFRRVKIKSPAYVLVHHAKDGFGQRRIIDLIRAGETSEVLSYFPEYQQQYDEMAEALNGLVIELEEAYDKIRHIPVQKDFAIEALKTRYSAALFQLRSGRVSSIRSAVLAASTEVLERLLGARKNRVIMPHAGNPMENLPTIDAEEANGQNTEH